MMPTITEAGTPDHSPPSLEQQAEFKQFAQQMAERVHAGFHNMLGHLTNAYAPFDPDSDTLRLRCPTAEEEAEALGQLFATFTVLLERAGFHHMTRAEIETTMQGASHWGIEMSVDWSVFDRVEVFYRGAGTGWRVRRPWWRLFRPQDVQATTDLDVHHARRSAPGVPAPPDRRVAFAPTYYPGTPLSLQASPIPLRPGEERSDVDFALQLVATARVDGTVTMPDGSPASASTQIVLLPSGQARSSDSPLEGLKTTRAGADGTSAVSPRSS